MNRNKAGLISFAIIIIILIVGGVNFFDSVWSFPGNFEFFKNFPSDDLPLGLIPLNFVVVLCYFVFCPLYKIDVFHDNFVIY